MKILNTFAALLAVATVLGAQDAPVRVTLEVDAPVVSVGKPIELTLTARVAAATEVPATLLGGIHLTTYVDGEPSIEIGEPLAGQVPVAAGTEIRRRIPVDPAALWPQGSLIGKSSIVFAWSGLDEARVSLRLVPDQTALDLDALDLAKTKVRLITSEGEMVVGFLPEKAPRHVRNFIKLSKDGFYNGTRFHRVISGFMIQGGDPYTKKGSDGQIGTGGSGQRLEAEFNDVKHERGILSMARSADPNSASSQFFVMHGSAPSLDGKYSVFGRLESGLETLDAIAGTSVRPSRSGEPSEPVEPMWLYAAVVEPVLQ
ncbi:MAG: peptidylprolyl isomerase [Planctomycetota bacterium]|nr:peptidylprolyl isomerase [Planctomycetota bacterium]MDA0934834.1 peptidylprolyl isomerase [Planctomycetota bacterium]